MSCKKSYFGGWGDCFQMLTNMVGGVLQEKGKTWTDTTAQTANEWRAVIAENDVDVRNALALKILSFTPTTDEPEIVTTALGKKYKVKNAIPSGVLYLDTSLDDYKHLHRLEGKGFEFIPFFDGGDIWMTRTAAGLLKGFRCRIALVAGFAPDDKTQSFPVHIFFDSYSEFKEVDIISPIFSFDDVMDYSAAGLNVKIATPYTGGKVVVQATKRGSGDAMTGLTQTDDWEIMASSFGTTTPVVVDVVTENGQGSYDLEITKGGSVNLAATDIITLQAHDDDGTFCTFLSHAFDVQGGT